MRETIVIDCDECVMQHTTACTDCVVTCLCERPSGSTRVTLDVPQERALRVLATAGLVPRLRHVHR